MTDEKVPPRWAAVHGRMLEIFPKRSCGHQVAVDGFAVPRIEVAEDAATGQWRVIYDGRFGIVAASLEELQRWLWLVANAQAVGEGYSCHGAGSVWRPNPHKVQVMCVGSVETLPSTGTLED